MKAWMSGRPQNPRRLSPATLISSAGLDRTDVGTRFLAALPEGHGAKAVFDWGGGLVWLSLPSSSPALGEDGAATAVRQAVDAAGGGHATLFRGPETLRAAIDVFSPGTR